MFTFPEKLTDIFFCFRTLNHHDDQTHCRVPSLFLLIWKTWSESILFLNCEVLLTLVHTFLILSMTRRFWFFSPVVLIFFFPKQYKSCLTLKLCFSVRIWCKYCEQVQLFTEFCHLQFMQVSCITPILGVCLPQFHSWLQLFRECSLNWEHRLAVLMRVND